MYNYDNHKVGQFKISIRINKKHYFVSKETMTGAELKTLGGIPPSNRLYRDEHGNKPDTPIPDDTVVQLKNGDHFYDLAPGIVGSVEGEQTLHSTLDQQLQGFLPSVREELMQVIEDFGARVTVKADKSVHIEVPRVPTGPEWNRESTPILIIVPPGYPQARPSGFMAAPDLLYRNQQPRGTGVNPVDGKNWLQFCWSPGSWDARYTLWHYVKFAQSRFLEVG